MELIGWKGVDKLSVEIIVGSSLRSIGSSFELLAPYVFVPDELCNDSKYTPILLCVIIPKVLQLSRHVFFSSEGFGCSS